MAKNLLIYLLLLFSILPAYSQKENNIFFFGNGAGLDFSSGSPQVIQGSLKSLEAAASICDGNGNLLFYTDGNTVYDRNHNIMSNGTGILGGGPLSMAPLTNSSTQGAVIVKSVSDNNQYYLFTNVSMERRFIDRGRLRYSVIDMSLNNGLGMVLPTHKNIVIAENVGEKMAVALGKGCYYWLIVRSNEEPAYLSFKIDKDGVHTTPVASPSSLPIGDKEYGHLKMSPDFKYIAAAYHYTNDSNKSEQSLELADFNNETGAISNGHILDSNKFPRNAFILDFSPNSKLLYSDIIGSLHQYNLQLLPDINDMVTNKIFISSGNGGSSRLGPDNKIYIHAAYTPYISCIDKPDVIGTGCDFYSQALSFTTPPFTGQYLIPFHGWGIGSITYVHQPPDTFNAIRSDTLVCFQTSLTLKAPSGLASYQWSDGSRDSFTIARGSSVIWVSYEDRCNFSTDTFLIKMTNYDLSLTNDTVICPGKPFRVGLLDPPENATFLWEDGHTGFQKEITDPGKYSITVDKDGCIATATVNVQKGICDCDAPFVPNSFTPNNDGLNDHFGAIFNNCDYRNFSLLVFNRFGEQVFAGYSSQEQWDGTYRNAPCDAGVYYYLIAYQQPSGKQNLLKGDVTLLR